MGTVHHKSSHFKEDRGVLPNTKTYSFKPYKLYFAPDTPKSRLESLTANRGKYHAPKPRSGHRIVCDDINVYSFGGYNPSLTSHDEKDLAHDNVWSESKPLFKELWKYNISTGLWKKLNVDQIPNILASNAVLLSGRILLVFGGTGVPFGVNCSNDLYICDLQNSTDQLKFNLISATGNCPLPQYGQAIVLTNHYLYTIGGTTGFEYTCDVHRLNLRDGTWEAIYICRGSENEPPGRYRHEVAFDGQKMFVLGGGTAYEAFDFKTVFAFELETNCWMRLDTRPDPVARESFPTPRRCHSSVQLQQTAYIIGGYNGQLILRDIWRLDLITLQWHKFPSFLLDKGVYFHSSCLTSNGKLLTFGGIVRTENSSTRTNVIHSAWLCIPKLKEICWEAVMFYHRDLLSLSGKELQLHGLPNEFIQRLDLCK